MAFDARRSCECSEGMIEVLASDGDVFLGGQNYDNAIVVLAITTGSTPIFMTLIVTLISMIGTGMYLIKKYVL